jgi:tetratricopeptide (TPR) repeat protein
MLRFSSTLASLLLVGILVSSLRASPGGRPRAPEDAGTKPLPPGNVPADSGKAAGVVPRGLEKLIESEAWDEALNLVRNSVADCAPPQGGALHVLEARLLERADEIEASGVVYRRLLEKEEFRETARDELHELYTKRGLFDEAKGFRAELAEGGFASESEIAKLAAFAASIEGRSSECVRLLDTPELQRDSRALLLRANALLPLDKPAEAEELYLRVILESKDPKLLQLSHFGLGQVARIRGARATRALEDEKACTFGEAPWAELDWGLALRALGRRDEARERLEGVARSSPSIAPTARLALARLDEEEGRTKDALEHLVAALEGGVGDFLAYTRLGDLLVQEGSDEAGIEAYRLALSLFADFPPGRERLTRALAARGRWDEAPSVQEQSGGSDLPSWTWDRLLDGDLPFHQIAGDRDSIPALDPRRAVVALVYLRAGAPASALGWTVEVPTGQVRLLDRVRAEALELVGRKKEAQGLWENLAEQNLAPARERLALSLFADDPERARALWHELFQQEPQNARAYIRMGRALEKSGSLAEARDAYANSLESGWLSPEERRRVRVGIEDVEDALREKEETDSTERQESEEKKPPPPAQG